MEDLWDMFIADVLLKHCISAGLSIGAENMGHDRRLRLRNGELMHRWLLEIHPSGHFIRRCRKCRHWKHSDERKISARDKEQAEFSLRAYKLFVAYGLEMGQ